ncbi:MAG: ThiF family adenylyltransferase [Verrucomicrobiales bacterium]
MQKSPSEDTWNQRFGGVTRLYGVEAAEKLRAVRVLIIGIGGVGTWIAEALARSGVGQLGLMDGDDVCITNTNRQIHALAATVGQAKVAAMSARVRAIHPDLLVETISGFLTKDSLDVLEPGRWDVVVDAIDAVPAKCLLLATCRERGIPVVCCGGAGGKRDGTRVRVADLAFTVQDALLKQVRKRLRQEHDFPRGENTPFGIAAIYSDEKPAFPWQDGRVCPTPEPGSSLRLDCASGFGTASHVTGAFGLAAAGAVLEIVAGI